MRDALTRKIEEVLPAITQFRRDLHAEPEICFQEHASAAKVRAMLEPIPNLTVHPTLTGTDVVAVLNEGRPGPCLALRADMDALPIEEEAGAEELPYRSKVPGKMHACGHDGHTAMLAGTVRVLAELADTLPGRVVFIFQPAEEAGGGAKKLCDAGLFERFPFDAIIAQHAWPTVPLGRFALRPGAAMASNSPLFITVHGKGSHGAYPHRGVDPVFVAASIITALQSVVARTLDPLDAAVVTISQIEGGSATNIIPPTCRMSGTLRFLEPEVGVHLRDRVRLIAESTAQAHGATAEVRFGEGYPPTINEASMCALIERTARDLYGDDAIDTNERPSMGVEDFAYYGQKVPAAMYRLGIRPIDRDSMPPLHNPRFNFNDDALPIGIRMFCELARRYLQAHA